MTRKEFEALVLDRYNVRADYPFDEDLITAAFRHNSGRWFALAMNIESGKLGLNGGRIDVVNLKCAPEVVESMAGVEQGIYRAYHMNKTHWLTVALSECDNETVCWLLEISYDLTGGKAKRN
jgi:predicted DNA-binding protein (MmcQ/YjbR family)